MNEVEKKEIIELIDGLKYGEITIKKEAWIIVNVKKTESVKLSTPAPVSPWKQGEYTKSA